MAAVNRQMQWSDLIAQARLVERWDGPVDPRIGSVVEDSRQVRPGSCFVAGRGTQVDGHDFIPQAIEAGASAVVCEKPFDCPPAVAMLGLDSTRGVAGRLAAALYGLDERQRTGQLKLIGITGTNGKSTFCYLLHAILQAGRMPAALLGTISYELISRTIPASMTTPPAVTLMEYLAEAVEAGGRAAVMEVSSHALDQGRCDGLRFDVGVFSNLTGDHLDYHKDMDQYLAAKKRLFDGLGGEAWAVVNFDDPAGPRMAADCKARLVRMGVVEDESSAVDRDVYAVIRESTAAGTRFDMVIKEGVFGPSARRVSIHTRLIGRFNVYNCLAAATAACALGIEPPVVAAALKQTQSVAGRMQRVTPPDHPFTVLVDYAHTDDALDNALTTLRPLARGKLAVLFGCGGDRDRSKRPRMARVAARWADRVMVTSDNPRTEDAHKIIEDILAGFDGRHEGVVEVEPDRRAAIVRAIGAAGPGDIVLLAGKGHEDYQIIGKEKRHFDDVEVAAEALGLTGGDSART